MSGAKTKVGALAKASLACSLVPIVPGAPLVGALLGIVASSRAPEGARERRFAAAAIIVGIALSAIQLGVVPVCLMAWGQHKKCLVLEPIDRIIQLSESYGTKHRKSALPVFPTGRTDWTPQVTGCGRAAVADQWTAAPWRLMGFRMEQTRYHIQFKYDSDGSSLRIAGRADLDCDGSYSIWERKVRITPSGGFINRGPFVSGDPDELQ